VRGSIVRSNCLDLMVLLIPDVMKRILCFSSSFLLIISLLHAQGYESEDALGDNASVENTFQWPARKQMALSLTFDDARFSQVDKGIPLLDRYGISGTFYVSPGAMLERVKDWRDAVHSGHDIGNHTLVHPCSGNFPWAREKALEDYTLEKMANELDSASRLIQSVLGIWPSAFAYSCGQTFVGRGVNTQSYVPLVAARFETGRDWMNEGPNDPVFCDLARLNGTELDGKSFPEALKLIEEARVQGAWLVFAGHEMNDKGIQTSLLSTIDSICRYASDPANGIWIDNVTNIGKYVSERRELP
jgi:peptidoglycan-N-acetylglucosamine deacetylase